MSTPPMPSFEPANRNDQVDFVARAHDVYRLYAALAATFPLHEESGLGGKLVYAGQINAGGRDLLYAANIAGSASLAATADPEMQKMAIREGVVDFFVTSLVEALRILKNEIRKGQAVSVGVGVDPHRLVAEMKDRGVLPDLLPPSTSTSAETALDLVDREDFQRNGARLIRPEPATRQPYVSWSVNSQHARWLPRLDLCAQSVIPLDDLERHRWIRLAPRYLGRLAQRAHGVPLTQEELERFRDMARACVFEQSGKDPEAAAKEPLVVTIQPVSVT